MSHSARFVIPKRDASDGTSPAESIHLHLSVRLEPEEARRLFASSKRRPTQQDLLDLASHIYDARRARDRMLGNNMFGEPAWDMLLACYCLPARGEKLTVTALSYAANIAPATGHRWQQTLMKRGLIERGAKGRDARRQFVKLTQVGREVLEDYLTRLFYCDTAFLPRCEEAEE